MLQPRTEWFGLAVGGLRSCLWICGCALSVRVLSVEGLRLRVERPGYG
jgi:hypothetical protein